MALFGTQWSVRGLGRFFPRNSFFSAGAANTRCKLIRKIVVPTPDVSSVGSFVVYHQLGNAQ